MLSERRINLVCVSGTVRWYCTEHLRLLKIELWWNLLSFTDPKPQVASWNRWISSLSCRLAVSSRNFGKRFTIRV